MVQCSIDNLTYKKDSPMHTLVQEIMMSSCPYSTNNAPQTNTINRPHIGQIRPIDRAIQFADKFPDVITEKTQLQRFLGSLNYVKKKPYFLLFK